MKHGLLGGLSSVKDSSLQRVDEAQSLLSNTITGGIEAIGGGSKLEDCVLQVSRELGMRGPLGLLAITADVIMSILCVIAGHMLPYTRRGD